MKKLAKLLLSIVLMFIVVFGVFIATAVHARAVPSAASGNVANRIEQLKSLFPNGSYFSANRAKCSHGTLGACSNCKLSSVMSSLGYSGLNGITDGWTCVAFARFAFWYIFSVADTTSAYSGNVPSGSSKVTSFSEVKVGDLVVFGSSHYAIYLGNNQYYDSNNATNNPNIVHVGSSFSGFSYAIHANNYDSINGSSSTTDCPNLLSPGDFAQYALDSQINLSWQNINVSRYHLVITSPSGSADNIYTNSTSASYIPNSAGTWRWKVRYESDTGAVGGWSAERSLVIIGNGPTPPPASGGSIQVEYFSGDSSSFNGSVVYNEFVDSINKNWGTSRPSSSVPNIFSARFTQQITLSGWYAFSYEVEDCIKIWIGSDCIIDNWGSGGSGSVTKYFNGTYTMKVEYASHGGDAKLIVNCTGTTEPVTLADLLPTLIQYDNSSLYAGGSVFFDSGIYNGSSVGTADFNVSWFVNGERLGYGYHVGVSGNQTLLDDNSYFIWNPSEPGSYTITFEIDSDNYIEESNENNNSTSVTVQVSPALTIVSVSPNDTSLYIGKTIAWTINAEGGSGTKSYRFKLYRDGIVIVGGTYGSANTYQYAPTKAGTYMVRAYVVDDTGTVTKDSAGVIVKVPLSITSVKSDKTATVIGSAITWTVAATGGSGTKAYRFKLYKNGAEYIGGSFGSATTYKYTPAETGTFKVRVYVKDDTGTVTKDSANVIVNKPLSINNVTADKTSVYTGTAITWTANATGGVGTRKYRFLVYKDGVELTSSQFAASASYKYTPKEKGTYRVRAYVMDSTGTISLKSADVIVKVPLSITSVKSDKTTTVIGSAITWTAATTGGSGAKAYRFKLYKNGAEYIGGTYGSSSTYKYTPAETGTYKVRTYVKDSTGIVTKDSTDVIVKKQLSITSVTADKTSAIAGSAITWTAAATGGAGTKSYRFLVYKDGAELASSKFTTSATYKYTPTEAGTYRVRAYVMDSTGTVSLKSTDITVKTPLTITSLSSNVTSIDVGSEITWTVSATGGSGTKTYRFKLYKDGAEFIGGTYSSARTYKYNPNQAGTYNVRVYVKDDTGTVTKDSKNVAVE